MREVRDAFGFGNAICANGALHYDLMNEKVIEQWLIPIQTQFEFVTRMRKALPTVSFAVEYDDKFHREKIYAPRWDLGADNVGVISIEEKLTQPAFKIMARCSDFDYTSDEMLAIAEPLVSDIVTVTHSNPEESLLEISAKGVSKGETLEKLAARLGIGAEDSVTFGDNPNDFSMLKWAGRSWAMSNGHQDGVKNAKFVAQAHHLDGVAIVIEQLLELPA
jgi:hydroxymethylpyrimidine pyrophosphatase-like HAD family hydrolase